MHQAKYPVERAEKSLDKQLSRPILTDSACSSLQKVMFPCMVGSGGGGGRVDLTAEKRPLLKRTNFNELTAQGQATMSLPKRMLTGGGRELK
jgi:hypothetical protein